MSNIVVSTVVLVAFLNNGGVAGLAKAAKSATLPTTTLTTPWYAFDAPAGYINNQSAKATAACITTDQLWASSTPTAP